jgi:threonine dehydratase
MALPARAPGLRDVLRARQAIRMRVRHTPLAASPRLADRHGSPVLLKLECQQLTGSFKIRGALWAALQLAGRAAGAGTTSATEPSAALVTASAGNHGIALAAAAATVGLPLVVFTPAGAPATKLDAIARLGATLRAEATDYDEAERLAIGHAARTGAHYVSPYNHPDVIAGAGTVGLEILDDEPRAGAVLVPVGGGGLVSGVALAVKAFLPDTRVIGVEAAHNPAFTTALPAGRIVAFDVRPTIADGLAGNLEPGSLTFDIVRELVDEVVTVSEETILRAMRDLAGVDHVVAEGAGAVAVAALLTDAVRADGRPVVAIVSGANVDRETLASALRS